jgi:hypothetical protein
MATSVANLVILCGEDNDALLACAHLLATHTDELRRLDYAEDWNIIAFPEACLHPKKQLLVGDSLVRKAVIEQEKLIVLTHSESILLRIMRRIRLRDIASKDILIVCVERRDNGDILSYAMPLNKNGEFIDGWHEGFFDQNSDEVFDRNDLESLKTPGYVL